MANVAKPGLSRPEVAVKSTVFSDSIADNEILRCPEIREHLRAQPSPFREDNNAGGGCDSEPAPSKNVSQNV